MKKKLPKIVYQECHFYNNKLDIYFLNAYFPTFEHRSIGILIRLFNCICFALIVNLPYSLFSYIACSNIWPEDDYFQCLNILKKI